MWRWSTCSGLTIFEFINHDKVTFLSARTSPNSHHFPHQVKRVLPLDFALEREPKNIFHYQCDIENCIDQVLKYYLMEMNIHTQNLLVCNSGQYIYIKGLFNFFFVLQDLIDRINYFWRIAFLRNLPLTDF